jgi:DNA-binding NarL/FixJ family response regulator
VIRVAIADDQVLLREMLEAMLTADPGIEVVGSVGDGAQILEVCQGRRPHVVLLDIRMPAADGIDALTRIKEKWPAVKVLMLTTFHEEKDIVDIFAARADGYLLKDVKPEALVMAVKCAAEDLCVVHRQVYDYLLQKFAVAVGGRVALPPAEGARGEALFDTVDRSIIRLIAEGRCNKEIADALHYAEGTVKNRISRMLSAAGLKDRTHIVMFALHNGLL